MKFVKYKRFILEQTMLQGFLALQAGLETAGIEIAMVSAWRGEVEQEEAFRTGHSKAHFGNSPHNYGLAFDICVIGKDGKGYWPADDDPIWQKIGQTGKSIGLTWGGDFKSILDLDHFEYAGFQPGKFKLYPEAPLFDA